MSDERQHILQVDRNTSRCGDCGKQAFPHEKTHAKLAGYGPTNGDPGCGVEWTHIAPVCIYAGVDTALAEMRPDLILIASGYPLGATDG